jgi:hypothetical protein
MNYFDILPNDVIKIINRKVQDLHIIERRKERKENKKIQREKKRIADNKRMIYSKFVCLYQEYLFLEEKKENERLRKLQKIEEEKYSKKINEQHKYLVTLRDIVYDVKNTIDNILEIEFCIGGEIPYMTVIYSNNGNVHKKKFF